MIEDFFMPADILLPVSSFDTWSVIACDQFSSDRDYWERVHARVTGKPSTLSMVLPEAYLGEVDVAERAAMIGAVTEEYLRSGVLRKVSDSFVYLERTLRDGRVRRGLVGAVCLDRYEFAPGARADILASEGTVLDRLPPRVIVREKASLETSHVMAFIDDKARSVIEPLGEITGKLEALYDFTLMEGGGRARGYRVHGAAAERVMTALRGLGCDGAAVIIGDGNHSLAGAKTYWDAIKGGLDDSARASHPARFALVELNNVYDEAISFEAIHRAVFDTKPEALLGALARELAGEDGYAVRWASGSDGGTVKIPAGSVGELIGRLQAFLDGFIGANGGRIDYIHGDDEAIRLAAHAGSAVLLLPSMDKADFFETVNLGGVFPKKSFSVGHAEDKRYYLECRRIKP